MMTAEAVLSIVYDCLAELNRQLPADQQLAAAPDTVLVGEGGNLDSLGLITFLVSLEDAVQSRLGLAPALVDEERMADPSGPYRTLGSLAAWMAAGR